MFAYLHNFYYSHIFRYFINKKRKKESLAESMRKIEEEKKKEG